MSSSKPTRSKTQRKNANRRVKSETKNADSIVLTSFYSSRLYRPATTDGDLIRDFSDVQIRKINNELMIFGTSMCLGIEQFIRAAGGKCYMCEMGVWNQNEIVSAITYYTLPLDKQELIETFFDHCWLRDPRDMHG